MPGARAPAQPVIIPEINSLLSFTGQPAPGGARGLPPQHHHHHQQQQPMMQAPAAQQQPLLMDDTRDLEARFEQLFASVPSQKSRPPGGGAPPPSGWNGGGGGGGGMGQPTQPYDIPRQPQQQQPSFGAAGFQSPPTQSFGGGAPAVAQGAPRGAPAGGDSEFASLFSAAPSTSSNVIPPSLDDAPLKSPPSAKPRAQTTNVYGATQFRLPAMQQPQQQQQQQQAAPAGEAGDYSQLFSASGGSGAGAMAPPDIRSASTTFSGSSSSSPYNNLFGDAPAPTGARPAAATMAAPYSSMSAATGAAAPYSSMSGATAAPPRSGAITDNDFDSMFASIPSFGSQPATATSAAASAARAAPTTQGYSNDTFMSVGSTGRPASLAPYDAAGNPRTSSSGSVAGSVNTPYDSRAAYQPTQAAPGQFDVSSALTQLPTTPASSNPYSSRPLNDLDDLSARLAALKR